MRRASFSLQGWRIEHEYHTQCHKKHSYRNMYDAGINLINTHFKSQWMNYESNTNQHNRVRRQRRLP